MRGDAKATAKIAQCLFSRAMSGDTASMIFWMKVRAGWSERVIQQHTGENGDGPVCLRVRFVTARPSEPPEQWLAERRLEHDQVD